MSAPLTHEEHLRVLACIQEIYRCRSLPEFPAHALRAFATLIPSNLAAFNEVNVPRERLLVAYSHPIRDERRLRRNFERYSAEHPVIRYILETGDGQAVKISDFVSPRAYHRLAIYRHLYAALGAEDQLSLTIRSDAGVIIAVAFNRPRRTFTEEERVMLNLVRPHLLQAYAGVEELAGCLEERDDLRTALRETGHGLIALGANGRVRHATPGARACIAGYVGDDADDDALPRAVAAWLADGGTAPFTATRDDGRLIVRCPRDGAGRLLLVSEETVRVCPPTVALTRREAEILRWIAAGRANAEIATIVGLAPGTVKRHVERLLAKLEAPNRTAAAEIAHRRGLLDEQ